MATSIQSFEKTIGYTFNDKSLLQLALTHRSASKANNERLEFLGDSILGFVVAEDLFNRFPTASEGELSGIRAKLVNGESLTQLAKDMQFSTVINLGAGELKSGGKQRPSILADAVEAVIGAIYLDCGMEICRARVISWYQPRLDSISLDVVHKDSKTRLQEILQSRGDALPVYTIESVEGEAHDQTFIVQCSISLLTESTTGSGKNRRVAEQLAATKALQALGL